MYLVKTRWWLRKLYSSKLTWKIPTARKEIYLTFDDGPHPTITPFVLNCLKKYDAKATFFCLGKNVRDNPDVFKQIVDEGHAVGNHTFDHLNGWKTGDSTYLKDVVLTNQLVSSHLFRPPYGRISRSQIRQLSPAYRIVMWDVLSGDFDINVSPETCYQNVITKAEPGSIIVFHDSEKAFSRLEYALPEALAFFAQQGYEMKAIA
jgi:peptidoglycan/xylan/chitin deacetylase (PgdA/CDA1 family)